MFLLEIRFELYLLLAHLFNAFCISLLYLIEILDVEVWNYLEKQSIIILFIISVYNTDPLYSELS